MPSFKDFRDNKNNPFWQAWEMKRIFMTFVRNEKMFRPLNRNWEFLGPDSIFAHPTMKWPKVWRDARCFLKKAEGSIKGERRRWFWDDIIGDSFIDMTLYGDDNKEEKKPFMQHRQKVGGKSHTNFFESEEAEAPSKKFPFMEKVVTSSSVKKSEWRTPLKRGGVP